MPRKKKRKRGFPRSHLPFLRDSLRGERVGVRKRERHKNTFDPHALLATMIDRISALNLETPEGDPVSVAIGKSTFEHRLAAVVYSLTARQIAARDKLETLRFRVSPSYWHEYTIVLDDAIHKDELPPLFEIARSVLSRYYRRRTYISVLFEAPTFERGAKKSPANVWRALDEKSVAGADNLKTATLHATSRATMKVIKGTETDKFDTARGFQVTAIAPRSWRP